MKRKGREAPEWRTVGGCQSVDGIPASLGTKKGAQKVLLIASVASMIDQFNMPNIRLLQEMGYEVHVACNFKDGNTCNDRRIHILRQILQKMRVRVHQWDCPRRIFPIRKCVDACRQLCGLLDRHLFVWVHCHSPVGGALARIAAHRARIPVMYTAHGFHFYKGAPFQNWLLYYPVEKLLAHWTDVLVTVNREDYRYAVRHLRAGRIYHIPGVGVDTEKFAGSVPSTQSRTLFRQTFDIPKDAWVLLSVGELNEGKNHRFVISALAAIQRQDVYYLICGQGAMGESLQHYADSLGVSSRLRLAGYQENMPWIYQNVDIFIFPSMREGMPVALMEAMAAGLPCIVSDIRGSRELVDGMAAGWSEPCGISFRLEHPEQMWDAVSCLLENETLRERYGRRAQEKIRRYDIIAVQAQMRRIYSVMPYARKMHPNRKIERAIRQDGRMQLGRKIKVLHVLKTDSYAGAENVALTLCKGLRGMESGAYEPAYTSVNGSIARRVRETNTAFYPMRTFCVGELRRVLQEFGPDIVHAHDFSASVLCAFLKRDFCLVSHLHNDPPWIRKWGGKSWAYFLVERKMNQILVVSDEVREEAVFLRNAHERVLSVPNPVDAVSVRQKAGAFAVCRTDLVFVGRLTRQKNPERFIRTAARLCRWKKDLSAVMIGDGEQKEACRKMIRQFGMERHIRVIGFVENPYPYLKRASLFLATSDWEGFGLAAAEAVVLHTPVLAMASGGLRSVFRDFPQALCDTEEELYTKAAALLRNRVRYERFRQEMCRNVRSLNTNQYVGRMADIYGGLLQ